MTKHACIAALCLSALIVGSAPAQRAAQPAQGLMLTNRQFVTEATHGNLAEIQLGRLAQQKGSSQMVKEFGQRMVRDHSGAQNELGRIAQALGLSVPNRMDPVHQAVYDHLNTLEGGAFDQAYWMCQIMDHEATYFKLTNYRVPHSRLAAFARRTAPKVLNHLQMLRQRMPQATPTARVEDR